MNNDISLPSHLVVLRESLGRAADTLRQRLQRPVAKSGFVTDIATLAGHHVDRIAVDVERLGDEVARNLAPAAYDSGSTRAEIEHAVVRLQVRIEQLLDNYDELRRLDSDEADFRGWYLLTEIYRDTLGQIQRWLDDIVGALDDVQAALDSRTDGVGKQLEVTVSLNMTAPTQFKELTDWMERRMSVAGPEHEFQRGRPGIAAVRDIEADRAHHPGMRETIRELDEQRGCLSVIAAFLFGWIVGGG